MSKHRATGNPRGRPPKLPFDFGEGILASFRSRVDPATCLVRPHQRETTETTEWTGWACGAPLLTKSSQGADSFLTGRWDTRPAMENENRNKERQTRIELAIGLAVVALLYLIDWLNRW